MAPSGKPSLSRRIFLSIFLQMEEHVTDSAAFQTTESTEEAHKASFAGSAWEWGLCSRSRGGLRLSLAAWRNRYICRQDRISVLDGLWQ